MINDRKILEFYFEDISQKTISSSTGHSRNTVYNVDRKTKKLGLEKQAIEKSSGGDKHPELNGATYQGSR